MKVAAAFYSAALLSLFLISMSRDVNGTQVTFDDNAYSNIVVAVSPDVPDNQASTIIQNIKLMITKASRVLYRATESRAYFKDVRILIPDSWGSVQANVTTWETYNKADVRVAPPSSSYGDTPYTLQSGGCGQAGEYIHLSPNYLLTLQQQENIAKFGPSDKVFVHEWAHLRYGVFDEYGKAGDRNYPLFYRTREASSTILPNLCTDRRPVFNTIDTVTQGKCTIDPSTGLYDRNCVYILEQEFQPGSSLMANHSLDSVVDFCKDEKVLTHVYDTPNKHNAMCGARSVWTVITSHPDFLNNNNPPTTVSNLEPTFNVVKSGSSRYVLVADVSGSMDFNDRIGRLFESARRWIRYDFKEGSQLGLVQFSDWADLLSNLTIVTDDDESRNSLISKLPQTTISGTCIGCGLQKALEVLEPTGKGGIIMLMTDGEENVPPYISEVLPAVIAAEVRVVSIAFGRSAEDKIEDLAAQTNGLSFFVDDNDNSQGLNDAFIGSMTFQPAVPSDKIVVLLFQKQYQRVNTVITDGFVIDSTVGRNFVFRIDYTQRDYIESFALMSPSGAVNSTLEYDDFAKLATLKLDLAEIGKWNFTINVTTSTTDSIAVTVTTQTRSNATTPITTECYVPDETSIGNATSEPVRILAKVMQGFNPVVSAKVKAFVEMPDQKIVELELLDNGAFADTTADDGIYSRFFTAATFSGRYTVACEVWDDGNAYVKTDSSSFSGVSVNGIRINEPSSNGTMVGGLSRMAVGGSFKITNPIPVNDSYPPSRVFDLVVTALHNANKSFALKFTAPGDDLDHGRVATYDIKYSTNFDDLREKNFPASNSNATLINNELEIVNGPINASESGSIESIMLQPINMSLDVLYYIALRGVDEAGNVGESSNIVSVSFQSVTGGAGGRSSQATIGIVVGALLAAILIEPFTFW